MIETLPLFHRISNAPVLVLGEGDGADAKRRLVERAGGVVVDDLDAAAGQGARLAFIAHEEEARAQADAARARAAGMLVNAMDRPALCDFTVPSILERSPVLVAVGTGGASAGLAKQLRLRLEALLPQTLGGLALALKVGRGALRKRFPDSGERRRALDAALAAGGALDPLVDGEGDARFSRWIAAPDAGEGGLAEITLRSDDPEDLTLREARLLGTADTVLAAPAIPAAILARVRADAVRGELLPDTSPEVPASGLVVVLRRALSA
ncbi:siroheme synthase [Novosphingobium sp. YJ-S2-02]|uniref:precorrin-2 dehydrogenase n=1 Tax=Novosphingobium aureum TaxID=2792964 RepID=A0A931H9B0_9SPHN|nr:NAD(P)-dependent oxidoreductase [Novosphingobium aureum]MBH0111721.1 siroheme synthase [Novosphingobium aureum]